MNERIKELKAKAYQICQNKPEGEPVSHIDTFAELIVRECADVLDKQISPPSHPMNSLGYKLKQHFGVEP